MKTIKELEQEGYNAFQKQLKENPDIYERSYQTAYILGWVGVEYEKLRLELEFLKNTIS